MDCRGDALSRELKPCGWDIEEGGAGLGAGLVFGPVPVFSWSFSALRLSTVICGKRTDREGQWGFYLAT